MDVVAHWFYRLCCTLNGRVSISNTDSGHEIKLAHTAASASEKAMMRGPDSGDLCRGLCESIWMMYLSEGAFTLRNCKIGIKRR